MNDIPGGTTLYAGVAEWVISCLDRGIYKVGDRIPSIRTLSATLQVSINTVREAYDLLERRRYIECRPQSGYVVRKAPPPAIGERSLRIERLDPREVVFCRIWGEIKARSGSTEAANLAVAMPDSSLLPVKKLGALMADAMRLSGSRVLEYCMMPGFGPLREQLARLSVDAGMRLSPDRIVVTNGCCEALFLSLMAVCRRGDTVAVESPLYFNVFHMVRDLGLKVLEIPSSPRDGIPPDVLRFGLSNHRIAACLVIPTFSNPTGSCIPDGSKRELVADSFPEGTRVARPSGGFLLWIELPERIDACAFYDLAIREDIVFPPGVLFTASGGFENFLRLNGGLRGPEPERAVRRIGELAGTLAAGGKA